VGLGLKVVDLSGLHKVSHLLLMIASSRKLIHVCDDKGLSSPSRNKKKRTNDKGKEASSPENGRGRSNKIRMCMMKSSFHFLPLKLGVD